MKLKYKHYLVIFSCFLFAIACKKETLYEGPTGNLKGYVKIYDPNFPYDQQPTDHSGVEILIEGSSPEIKVNSEKDGSFIFQNVKSGVYDLVYKKDGYMTLKIPSYLFTGGKITTFVNIVNLYKFPEGQVTDLKVDTGINAGIGRSVIFNAKLANPSYRQYRYFLSEKSNVSYTNYQVTGIIYSNGKNIEYDAGSILWKYYQANKKLYVIIYPSLTSSISYYTDIDSGLEIYLANPDQGSNVAEFVLPQYPYFY